jgi:hypothetical protein
MLKGFFGAIAVAALATSNPALAQAARAVVLPPPPQVVEARTERVDAAELAEARAIMEIMFPVEEREATFHELMQNVLRQIEQAVPADAVTGGDPGLTAILSGFRAEVPTLVMPTVRLHLPRIVDATAVAYTHEFDLAELKAIRTFAETPEGRHYLSRSTALIGDPVVAAANSAYLADVNALAMQARQELQAKLVDYLRAHPDVAARITAAGRN